MNNSNDILNINNTISNLDLNNLTDVDLSIVPAVGQILRYDGTNFIAANESGGVTSLSALTDVDLGTLSNGDILSYDLPNTKWINSGFNFTPAALEYMQFKILTGSCEISPNTTGEFNISSAIGFFTPTPTAGTGILDTTHSSGIISIINTKRI